MSFLIYDCGLDHDLAKELVQYTNCVSEFVHFDRNHQHSICVFSRGGIYHSSRIEEAGYEDRVTTDIDLFIERALTDRSQSWRYRNDTHLLKIGKDVELFFDFFEIPESGVFGCSKDEIRGIRQAYGISACILSNQDRDRYDVYQYLGYKEIFSAEQLSELGFI